MATPTNLEARLVEKDRDVEEAGRLYRGRAFEACRKLIARFG